MRKQLTIAVMCCTALSSTISTAAYADTIPEPVAAAADQDTLDAMQAQCDWLAAAHDTSDGDIWTGVVVEGAVTKVSGPTEVPGTRVIDESTIEGSGPFTYSGLSIAGDPYRNGGSVNMFGDQRATQKNWSASTYNFTADFDSTFAHAFDCEIYQEDYNPEVPGSPVQGYYINNGTNPSGGEGSCQGLSPANPHWGQDIGNCTWVQTGPGTDPVPESWDPPVLAGLEAGTPVNQDQTDSLYAFEDVGGPVTENGDFFVGKVVICISPSTTAKKGVPGAWQNHNGYTGTKCTTAHFNVAPWGGGSQTSNGTYISVPAI